LRQEGPYTAALRPDLLLLDLNLPTLDGRVVLRTLRATLEWKTLPVMIFTGYLPEAYQQEVVALGVDRCLQKPAHLDDYLALGEDIATWGRWRGLVPVGGDSHQ
jgi:CheY-like chemotaxis protein